MHHHYHGIAYAKPYNIVRDYYDNGKYTEYKTINYEYPGDKIVKFSKVLYLLNPVGQASNILNLDYDDIKTFPVYSITLILIINTLGIFIFERKSIS